MWHFNNYSNCSQCFVQRGKEGISPKQHVPLSKRLALLITMYIVGCGKRKGNKNYNLMHQLLDICSKLTDLRLGPSNNCSMLQIWKVHIVRVVMAYIVIIPHSQKITPPPSLPPNQKSYMKPGSITLWSSVMKVFVCSCGSFMQGNVISSHNVAERSNLKRNNSINFFYRKKVWIPICISMTAHRMSVT